MQLRDRLVNEQLIFVQTAGELDRERNRIFLRLKSYGDSPPSDLLEKFMEAHYRLTEYLDRIAWIGKVLDEDARD